jgi:hypothetical protein
MKRDVTIQLRASAAERDEWQRLAKPYSLSEYIRQLLLKEQDRREQGEAWHVEEVA